MSSLVVWHPNLQKMNAFAYALFLKLYRPEQLSNGETGRNQREQCLVASMGGGRWRNTSHSKQESISVVFFAECERALLWINRMSLDKRHYLLFLVTFLLFKVMQFVSALIGMPLFRYSSRLMPACPKIVHIIFPTDGHVLNFSSFDSYLLFQIIESTLFFSPIFPL